MNGEQPSFPSKSGEPTSDALILAADEVLTVATLLQDDSEGAAQFVALAHARAGAIAMHDLHEAATFYGHLVQKLPPEKQDIRSAFAAAQKDLKLLAQCMISRTASAARRDDLTALMIDHVFAASPGSDEEKHRVGLFKGMCQILDSSAPDANPMREAQAPLLPFVAIKDLLDRANQGNRGAILAQGLNILSEHIETFERKAAQGAIQPLHINCDRLITQCLAPCLGLTAPGSAARAELAAATLRVFTLRPVPSAYAPLYETAFLKFRFSLGSEDQKTAALLDDLVARNQATLTPKRAEGTPPRPTDSAFPYA